MPAAAAASGSILGGGGETQKATTLFAPLFGTGFGGAATSGFDDAHAAQPILIAGTMSNLNIRLDQTEAVAATSYVFTVRKGATTATMADTTLTCTVSGATGTSCSDTRHSVVFLSTDLVDLKMAPTGTPTDHINVSWLVKFVPS